MTRCIDIGLGAVVPGDEYVLDEDLIALGHVEAHIHATWIRRVLALPDRDARLLKSVAQIVAEHGIAVARQGARLKGWPSCVFSRP